MQTPSPASHHELVSTTEAARLLSCSAVHVRRLVDAGDLPAADISGPQSRRRTLRIPVQGIRALVERQEADRVSRMRKFSRQPKPGKTFV